MPIGDDFVRVTCRIGQGAACCRYLAVDPRGFCCLKLDPALGPVIEARQEAGTMHAKGDNCPGIPE